MTNLFNPKMTQTIAFPCIVSGRLFQRKILSQFIWNKLEEKVSYCELPSWLSTQTVQRAVPESQTSSIEKEEKMKKNGFSSPLSCSHNPTIALDNMATAQVLCSRRCCAANGN